VLRRLRAHSVASRWFRRAWAAEIDLVAPELLAAEVANALLRYVRSGALRTADARAGLATVLADPIALAPLRPLVHPALDLALERDLSVYDACYVVLAERLEAPLVTADRRLAGATEQSVLLTD